MDSPMVLNAIQVGFSINTIRLVVLEKIQLGLDFTTGEALIEVLTEHKVFYFILNDLNFFFDFNLFFVV